MSKTHYLKILPEYFKAIWDGSKTFEIRKDDRGYQVGDTLVLREYDAVSDSFTGNCLDARITYITDYAQKDNYKVLAIQRIKTV